MSWQVLLTEDAVRDLEEIIHYLDIHESPGRADHVLRQFEKVFDSLSENPRRGVFPTELQAVGLREYRETFFKPYRVIYRVEGERIFVMLIADGRRDMQTLLLRRLLDG